MKGIDAIFVSRNLTNFPDLKQWCAAHSIALSGHALIETHALIGLEIPATEWIFFSSPKGLSCYLNHYPLHAAKIGVYGDGTLKQLHEFGLTADFVGKSGDSPQQIGRQFNALAGPNAAILFPLSQRSRKSISSQVDSPEKIELVTYHTTLINHELTNRFSHFVITSPSNFQALTEINTIEESAIFIVLGHTTAKTIRQTFPTSTIIISETPSENGLIKTLEKLI